MRERVPARHRSIVWRIGALVFLRGLDRRLQELEAKNGALADRITELERTVVRLDGKLKALEELMPRTMRSRPDEATSERPARLKLH